jgi:hypothetical protein
MAADPTTGTFSMPITGSPSGSADVLLEWAITSPANFENPIRLAPGLATAITTGITSTDPYSLLAIIPPTDNTQTLSLGGLAGSDTFDISPNTPTLLAGVLSGFLTLTLGAGTGVTIITRWF